MSNIPRSTRSNNPTPVAAASVLEPTGSREDVPEAPGKIPSRLNVQLWRSVEEVDEHRRFPGRAVVVPVRCKRFGRGTRLRAAAGRILVGARYDEKQARSTPLVDSSFLVFAGVPTWVATFRAADARVQRQTACHAIPETS